MKILFFLGKSQYGSTAVFIKEMAGYMFQAGHEIDLLDGREVLSAPEEYLRKQTRILRNSYDVVFTINGMLLEEGLSLGQELQKDGKAIFCTYLMDHPLIHHERLKNCYPKIFVLSPDRNHVKYTDQYLKHIWGTAFLAHAGCGTAHRIPYTERKIDISFMASYTAPDRVRTEFDGYPPEMRQLLESVADLLIRRSEFTVEQAVLQVFRQYGIQWQEEEIAPVMPEFRIVDRYIRAYYRDKVIRTLVDAGISVDVYGDGWEQFSYQDSTKLRIHGAVSFPESLDIIGNSKISLNIMPWFKDGSHDRVFTAMLCGAICLTDGSAYLEEELRETENVYFYSLKGLKYLPAKVQKILADPGKAAQVAENGRKLAEERHTWANRAEEVLDYLGQLLSMEEVRTAQEHDIPCGCSSTETECDIDSYYEEVISKNSILLRQITRTVGKFRKQDYLHALRWTAAILTALEGLVPVYVKWKDVINANGEIFEENALLLTLQDLLEAQQKRDYIYVADILELSIMPFVTSIQEAYAVTAELPVLSKEGYRLELTSCGEYTLAVETGGKWSYLHTNGNPWEEGRSLAESWFDGEHYDYVVYGLGLGYHLAALLQIDEAVRVRVLEPDSYMIQLAREYGIVSRWEALGRLEIIFDPQFTELVHAAENLTEEEVFVVYHPALALIPNVHYKEQLEQYFTEYSSMQTQLTRLKGNFLRNQKYFGQEVTELREQFAGKTVYLIAAGPSLDKNMMELKHLGEDDILLSTGTVLKKLLKAGIQPDYVIITDGGSPTWSQTKNLEETGVPLLYLSTVYHRILAEYPGKHYLICQAGFEKSEQYAKGQGYPQYETGGSVTTTALGLCIAFGCRRVVFVGLDLAYTGNRNHAQDTAYSRDVKSGDLFVPDIYGKKVATARNLNIYRQWIEKRIGRKDASGIEFIDATEGGARIEGTQIRKLKDVL